MKTHNPIKQIDLNKVKMAMMQYAAQGNAILGIRGSGKSYTGTAIAEQLMDAGIPIIAFDPIGVWKNLKIPGKGKGYKVVVAHPEKGDLPLTPESAPEIVRAAMKNNISLVIDLYSIKLSKADWRTIVERCVRVLLHENGDHGLRHIFIEEAAEFIPQRIGPEAGRVYAEMEKLARMGGNARLGYTLINQRSEEVNKAVLELCDCLILHRQKGRNSLTALEKWLQFGDKASAGTIIESIPRLQAGECWIWQSAENTPGFTKIPVKNSFHPDRENPAPAKVGASTDVSTFVSTLNESLKEFEAKANENNPELLKKQIAELNRLLAQANKTVKQETVTVPVFTPEQEKLIAFAAETCANFNITAARMIVEGKSLLDSLEKLRGEVITKLSTTTSKAPPKDPYRSLPQHLATHFAKPENRPPSGEPGDKSLGICERSILTALAQYPQGRSKTQVALLSGYSHSSGGFNNALGKLRSRELITRGELILITEDGRSNLGSWNPLPAGKDLLDYWIGREGRCEAAILSTLYEFKDEGLTKHELAEKTGYSSTSGGFNNALGRLRSLELIQRTDPIKLNESFFNE